MRCGTRSRGRRVGCSRVADDSEKSGRTDGLSRCPLWPASTPECRELIESSQPIESADRAGGAEVRPAPPRWRRGAGKRLERYRRGDSGERSLEHGHPNELLPRQALACS